MNPFVLVFLLSSLGLGTTLTFMSSHWLLAWMGLEINTIAIIPLMAQHHHPRAVEATTKYFLTQATAAATILFATTTNAWLMGEWDILQLSHPLTATTTMLALALKIGLAPLHFWLPEVLQGLDLTTGLILSTWQKLGPFTLILQVAPAVDPTLLILIGLLSTLIGGWGGLNQIQLRKILAYSSIAHLGWMILIIQFAPHLALLSLMLYLVMTSATFLSFKMNTATNINSLALSWTKTPTLAILTALVLLSLGGLPPLTGFLPKWLILQELTKQGLPLIATFCRLTALFCLYFYLRLCYAMALTMAPTTLTTISPWRLSLPQTTFPLSMTTLGTLALLPLTPAMVALLIH
uniref:NADH-ubiquinone oxidoreductase chain 2 n=1 Tax=Dolichopteryx minuscula TaxID=1263171 RepID=A0A1W7GK33_9TELE|nr:NADH dehydrogenase subunit 2 [Dolichopteryx minuscula]BAX25336.1 NADH dehydrogenase subunit 2 [Dolichopteryx minuscula]